MLMRPICARPILKWAGGKTQLLDELLARVPPTYGRYIEPFFGGGALFFALQPKNALIADSNPELVNLYRQVAGNVEGVIEALAQWQNDEREFYCVRKLDWEMLPPAKAAARTLFLNKTCFNGLYRVNRAGQFNVPFGRYAKPNILDIATLSAASKALRGAEIVCADFRETLHRAAPGDFVFLDPPYVPASAFADFKRYTKEQFGEDDHRMLAGEFRRLAAMGSHVVLTNSNTPLVKRLYADFETRLVETRRHISCDGSRRTGEDLIIVGRAKARRTSKTSVRSADTPLSPQLENYPPTRFMGSKSKLLGDIWKATHGLRFDSVVDLFTGSGVVGYMFKCQGKHVISNDHMAMSWTAATAMIENSGVTLGTAEAQALLRQPRRVDDFVRKTFGGLYFSPEDELTIDVLRTNIAKMDDRYQRAIALTALIRGCMKKRPRGIFTYTGMRYDDGRHDLRVSLADHFLSAVSVVNSAVMDNGAACHAVCSDALEVEFPKGALIYLDPPYWSPLSDNEYVRRYHFLEGLARDWKGVEIQAHTTTKKFKSYDTPFRTRRGTMRALVSLMERAKDNPLVLSYASNGEPGFDEMMRLLKQAKRNVAAIPVRHKYSFGNQGHKIGDIRNTVDEYLFVAC